ncbi:hypothetical protein [Prescottella subtropica]|uniref:hypothetical protein n=1 Tax=Prescottella subtropica TaxID=2545757 RepID=UPI0010F72ED3|nr:hypothetical protein [Prescottella subtropica]
MAYLLALLDRSPAPTTRYQADPVAVAQQFHDDLDAAASGRVIYSPSLSPTSAPDVVEPVNPHTMGWTAAGLAALAVGALGRLDVLTIDWSALPLT